MQGGDFFEQILRGNGINCRRLRLPRKSWTTTSCWYPSIVFNMTRTQGFLITADRKRSVALYKFFEPGQGYTKGSDFSRNQQMRNKAMCPPHLWSALIAEHIPSSQQRLLSVCLWRSFCRNRSYTSCVALLFASRNRRPLVVITKYNVRYAAKQGIQRRRIHSWPLISWPSQNISRAVASIPRIDDCIQLFKIKEVRPAPMLYRITQSPKCLPRSQNSLLAAPQRSIEVWNSHQGDQNVALNFGRVGWKIEV